MASSTRGVALAAIGGALGGTLLWFAVYPLVKKQIEGSVREQLATQLPAQLATQLDQRLAEYSITPTTISNLARMIDLFGRAGAAVPAGAAAATTGAAARTGTSGIGQVPVRMLMENDRMMRGAVPLSSLGPNGRAMGPGFSAHRTIARIL